MRAELGLSYSYAMFARMYADAEGLLTCSTFEPEHSGETKITFAGWKALLSSKRDTPESFLNFSGDSPPNPKKGNLK